MSREMRVSLDAEDFKKLVSGAVVRKDGSGGPIVIGLQDIGYGIMAQIVSDQIEKLEHHDKPEFQMPKGSV